MTLRKVSLRAEQGYVGFSIVVCDGEVESDRVRSQIAQLPERLVRK